MTLFQYPKEVFKWDALGFAVSPQCNAQCLGYCIDLPCSLDLPESIKTDGLSCHGFSLCSGSTFRFLTANVGRLFQWAGALVSFTVAMILAFVHVRKLMAQIAVLQVELRKQNAANWGIKLPLVTPGQLHANLGFLVWVASLARIMPGDRGPWE